MCRQRHGAQSKAAGVSERLVACQNAAQILALAELCFSTQIVAHGNAGVCNCLGKNKKTFVLTGPPSDNFATAFTVSLEQ